MQATLKSKFFCSCSDLPRFIFLLEKAESCLNEIIEIIIWDAAENKANWDKEFPLLAECQKLLSKKIKKLKKIKKNHWSSNENPDEYYPSRALACSMNLIFKLPEREYDELKINLIECIEKIDAASELLNIQTDLHLEAIRNSLYDFYLEMPNPFEDPWMF